MKILLTGGGGLVGRNVLEHPWFRDHEVLAPRCTQLNLLDEQAVRRYVGEVRPDCIVHAAGRVGGIQANLRQPVEFLVENWDMGRNVLLAAQREGVKRIINLGSSCIYPKDVNGTLSEESVLTGLLEPTNEGYALAKISVLRLGQYLFREYGTQIKTVIPCNLFGRWDKFHPDASHLVPAVIHKVRQALRVGAEEVEIWGDGTARREFMDASDLADFLSYALQNFDAMPDLLNVGPGADYSVNDYYRVAADVLGFKGTFRHDLSKPVGMKRKLLAIDKLKAFGWCSRVSLEQGVRNANNFYVSEVEGGTWAK